MPRTRLTPTGLRPLGHTDPGWRSAWWWQQLAKACVTRDGACLRCGSTRDLTADHVIPVAAGGARNPGLAGLQTLCRSCNASKGGYAA